MISPAAATLARLGYTRVHVLEGGTRAWEDAALPVACGREAMERYLRWEAQLDKEGRSPCALLRERL